MKTPVQKMLDAIDAIGPTASSGARGVIRSTYRMMDLAEQAIEESGLTRHDQQRSGIFLACLPNELIRDGINEQVIRAHYRELCGRARGVTPLDTATHAEALMMMSAQSLQRQFGRDEAHAMADLAYDVLGPIVANDLRPEPRPETGHEAEQIADARVEAIRAATVTCGRSR